MASRSGRPTYRTPADLYMDRAERYRQEAEARTLANDLVNNAGYDPMEIQEYHRRGGDLKRLVPRPKPIMAPEEQQFEELKRDAQTARLKRSITPTKQEEDRTTGQMFDVQVDEEGRRMMTPQKFTSGVARYRPKPEAFEGTTPEGDKWAMDRGEFGEAKDYRITKPHEDKIVKYTKPDGSVVNVRQKVTPQGVEFEELPTTINGKNAVMGKTERAYESPWVKGKNKKNENGEWVPDPETFEPSGPAKKTYSTLSRELNATKQAIYQVDRDLARYPSPEAKAQKEGLLRKSQNIEDRILEFEDFMKREAGEPVLQKLRGFKDGEYPTSSKAPTQSGKPVAHPQQDAAMKWLEKNPNDPRADAVRKKLGL